MRNSWLFFGNLDLDAGLADMFFVESQLSHGYGGHLMSQFASFVDGSVNHCNHLHLPGSMVLKEAISYMSTFAGAFFIWLSTGSNHSLLERLSGKAHDPRPRHCQSCSQVKHATSYGQDLAGLQFGSISQSANGLPVFFANAATSTIKHFWKEIEQLRYYPVLSLAAALVPPFDRVSSRILPFPPEIPGEQFNAPLDQAPCANDCRGCGSLSLPKILSTKDAVEPKTGIKFPTILDNHLFGQDTTEVLVGTGSRSMRVMRIKSLNVYAFGLYVHTDSVCEKLGRKYASVPVGELKSRLDFCNDLIRCCN
uniref:Chalcone--flavonone isomerase n=1 Tax=Anthurium amnicola TaxID=1678845 RepID=A0A1D1Z8X3_9ARAE